MKKLMLLLFAFTTISAIGKPKTPIFSNPCGDLKKVKYEIKTKSTKNDATHRIKDDYSIKIDNNSGVAITIKVLLADNKNNGPKSVEINLGADEKTKTVEGNCETPLGINKANIQLTVSGDKCKDMKKKQLVIPKYVIIHL